MANRAAGVLFIVLNHEGDVLSADMVLELAEEEGLNVKMVLTHEDISAGSREDPSDRRGLGGCLAVIKAAGAAAEQGKSLDECVAIAERMEGNLATLAVSVSGATHPATGEVIAVVEEGEDHAAELTHQTDERVVLGKPESTEWTRFAADEWCARW